MKHRCSKCGQEDELDPKEMAAALGSIRTPKREAAWKKRGEELKKMYADFRRRKMNESEIVVSKYHTQGKPTVSVMPPKNLPGVVFPTATRFDRGDAKPLFKPGHDKL